MRVGYLHIKGKETILVNPVITKTHGEIIFPNAGCMSFPGVFIPVKCHAVIWVTDDHGGERKFSGIEAVAVQHEIDHMDGVLMFDRQTDEQWRVKKVGRNDPCKCGSGKKNKKCCNIREV